MSFPSRPNNNVKYGNRTSKRAIYNSALKLRVLQPGFMEQKEALELVYVVREVRFEMFYALTVKKLDNNFATTHLYKSGFSFLVAVKFQVKAG